MPDFEYQRLTRGSSRSGLTALRSRSSLWLAPDHVLSVESNGYRESYKRFYFRDIQAISVQKTGRYRVWNIIVGILVLIFLGLAFVEMSTSDSDKMVGVATFGGIAGLFALILLLHLLSGKTCRTFLRTAVQIEELPSLCRVPRTKKALAKIRPLIAAAQGGELSAETVSARMREWSVTSGTAAATTVADDPNVPPRLES